MKKLKVTRKNARKRKTPYIFINGVRATTSDVSILWNSYKTGKEKISMKVDENGDIQFISED